LETLTSNIKNFRDKARLLANQQKESGGWLNWLPSSSLGTLLGDSSFRIAVALRTGQPVCERHTCICGGPADIFGHHRLSCRKSTRRHSRHGNINDIIKRALVSAEIPSILELTGCCKSDGKRADGMSLIPWKGGKALLWDVTCRDTLAATYIPLISKNAGDAARLGEDTKIIKYKELFSRFCFLPFSMETLGPWGADAKKIYYIVREEHQQHVK
jgi:hypothetical protein